MALLLIDIQNLSGFFCQRRIDLLQTRMFGNKWYVDVEISVDGSFTLQRAHQIAEDVHNRMEEKFPKVKHIMVHVNPAEIHKTEKGSNRNAD